MRPDRPARSGKGALAGTILPVNRVRTKDAKVDLLRNVDLFSACSKSELAKVAALVDEVDLPAGKVVTREGTAGREFFVIADGRVTVTMPDGSEVTLGPGSFFGEMSLLDGGPRVATVTAATPLHLLVVDRRSFRALLASTPSVTEKMLAELARRLRAVETASPTS